MTTDFFCKNIKRIAVGLAALVFCFCLLFAGTIKDCVYVEGKKFYFVSVSDGGLQACAAQVALDGGAGYVFQDKVVVSAYFSIDEAQKVAKNIQNDYSSAEVGVLSVGGIMVPSAKKKETEEMLKNLYGHIQETSAVADGLSDGKTQSWAKRKLLALRESYDVLSKTYTQDGFADICKKACRWIDEKVGGVIYSRDVRFLVCRLAEDFSSFVRGLGI